MIDRTITRSDLPFGRVLDISVDADEPVDFTEVLDVPEEADLLAFALTDPNGRPFVMPKGVMVEFQPVGAGSASLSSEEYRLTKGDTLVSAVVVNPHPGKWRLRVRTTVPSSFGVTVAGLHTERMHATATPGRWSSFKCSACKTGAKALALAIVAAAGAAAWPAAITAAVAAFLGAAAIPAGVFLGTVVGDTADQISKKLCQAARLCPP
jgi:hypothetical protein